MCGHPGLEAAPSGACQERVPAMPVPASARGLANLVLGVLELPADCATGGRARFPVLVEAGLHGMGRGRKSPWPCAARGGVRHCRRKHGRRSSGRADLLGGGIPRAGPAGHARVQRFNEFGPQFRLLPFRIDCDEHGSEFDALHVQRTGSAAHPDRVHRTDVRAVRMAELHQHRRVADRAGCTPSSGVVDWRQFASD